jgi:Flp pilus assembly protein TadG
MSTPFPNSSLPQTDRIRVVERPLSRRARLRTRAVKRFGEQGYIAVTTAILMPVLIVCLAMATDATYYYSRVVQIQRAADASSLAGVTRMPREVEARKTALDVAKRNGYENGESGISIEAKPPSNTNRRLTVKVTDTDVRLLFANFFRGPFTVSRDSTAEYVSNIPLGSVLNAIGTGPLTTEGLASTPQNFWLSVGGRCMPKENGDQFSSRYDGTAINMEGRPDTEKELRYKRLCDYSETANSKPIVEAEAERRATIQAAAAASTEFPGVSLNRDYSSLGYNYIIDVPCALKNGKPRPAPCDEGDLTTTALRIDVFDPVFSPDSLRRSYNATQQTPPAKPARPDKYNVSLKPRPGESRQCSSNHRI